MKPEEATSRDLAEALVAACRRAGTTHVFGVPGGGSNLDVVGAALEAGLDFVLTHTESAAAIMAGVMGGLTGAPGLAIATRGPGAASAVNGVAQALLDRLPMVMVTDCVSASTWARVSHQRLDQQQMMTPVSVASVAYARPEQAEDIVAMACAARPGPVHVDVDPSAPVMSWPANPPTAPTSRSPLADLLAGADRPVMLVGVGAVRGSRGRRRRIVEAVNQLAERVGMVVLCTYEARGVVPDASPWCAGVFTGATIESPLLWQADLIVGVGLDPVELIPAAWPYAAPVVLLGEWPIDDSTYFGDRVVADVVGEVAVLIEALLDSSASSVWEPRSGVHHRLKGEQELRAACPVASRGLSPIEVVDIARELAPVDAVATVDAGAHMLPAMMLWTVQNPAQVLISSGLATMGFALPAAIAAALAQPGTRVVCFTGDGGVGMVLGELETLARRALPITVVVFNDASLSLIAAKQHPTRHGGSTAVEYRPVDFAAVAAACGVPGLNVSDASGYRLALQHSFRQDGPMLLDVVVDPAGYGAMLDAIRGVRRQW